MPPHQLTGSRIRERRLDQGLRQAAVAQSVGISPSYLNLIEHNRRRIAGKLLTDLARVLSVDAALLTEGADTDLLDQMRTAAALTDGTAEVSRTEELAARYPGWSALIAAQSRRLATLEDHVQSLTDRMTHDPQLAASLHDVISSVTAIRSTASILVGPEALDADWQRRFHQNIYDDSMRLAAQSDALITYLDGASGDLTRPQSPAEAVEAFLNERQFHMQTLEGGEVDLAPILAAADFKSAAASALLKTYLTRYAADADAMPIADFSVAAQKSGYDPAILAQQFDVDMASVMRRMIAMPDDGTHPPMGLACCDASGALTLLKQVPGFAMPRAGAGCPLWPLFGTFANPGQPIRAEVSLPGPTPTRFLCYAVAQPRGKPQFDIPPVLEATMLVMADPPEGAQPLRPVGVSCRICSRQNCAARREPAMPGVVSG